jgi:hypothetical protein
MVVVRGEESDQTENILSDYDFFSGFSKLENPNRERRKPEKEKTRKRKNPENSELRFREKRSGEFVLQVLIQVLLSFIYTNSAY